MCALALKKPSSGTARNARVRTCYCHYIPVSKGGSNTARNLELRCGTRNRKRGAMI